MTQKSEITLYLINNPNSTTKQVQDAFDFPRPSTRRVLSELRKAGLNVKANPFHLNKIKLAVIKKLKEVIEAPEEKEELFDREIVKVLVYCPNEPHRAGFGHKLFALTYGNDPNDDHFDQLVDTLQLAEEIEQGAFDLDFKFTEDRGNISINKFKDCLQASTYGYDNEVQTDNPPFTFPDIEVGEE